MEENDEIYEKMRKCIPGVPRKAKNLLKKRVLFSISKVKDENNKYIELEHKLILGWNIEGFTISNDSIKIFISLSERGFFMDLDYIMWNGDSWYLFPKKHTLLDYAIKIDEIKFV